MPKSRVRKQDSYSPPPTVSRKNLPGKPWVGPAMSTTFVIGLVWLVVYYLSNGNMPAPIGNWNMLVGFGFLLVGFGLATQWR